MSRFTFKKSERLCSLKAIEFLYKNGLSLYASGIKFIYITHQQEQPSPGQVVFSVPKRSFKRAVDRNLIKRRMREAYRLHKESLYRHLVEKQKNLHLLVIYTSRDIMTFAEIETNLLKALNALAAKTN